MLHTLNVISYFSQLKSTQFLNQNIFRENLYLSIANLMLNFGEFASFENGIVNEMLDYG